MLGDQGQVQDGRAMRGAQVAVVRGHELIVVDGHYYLRVPEEPFGYKTTMAYRWRELGEFASFTEAEMAARRMLWGTSSSGTTER